VRRRRTRGNASDGPRQFGATTTGRAPSGNDTDNGTEDVYDDNDGDDK